MIVWGSGGKVVNCGPVRSQHCDICEKERQFNLILEYQYWGIYWIFNFITEKHYSLLCNICSRGRKLDSEEVESHLEENPIPFMRRYGCLTLLGIIAVFWILSAIGGC